MKDKRLLLSNILFHSRVLHGLRTWVPDRVVVLNYHRFRADSHGAGNAFDDHVFGPTAAQFEQQMVWLKHHVRILGEDELVHCLQQRRGPGELSVVVTTDDGYRDNYDLAYPILRRHGIPAIFFVPSGFIETRRLGWWDQLAYLVKQTAKRQITYDGQSFDLPRQRDVALALLNRVAIDKLHGNTAELLQHVAELCDIEPPSLAAQDRELMTWEQLREMAHHGISIGSHTHNHLILGGLDEQQQEHELRVSKLHIERSVGCTVRSLAYPVGGHAHFDADTKRLAKQAGYQLGFSFYSGFNTWAEADAFDLRRTVAEQPDRIGVAAAAILPDWLIAAK